MFICHLCNQVSKRRETPMQYVVETRTKLYPRRRGANPSRTRFGQPTDDEGGTGWEIVKVVLTHKVCPVKENINGSNA